MYSGFLPDKIDGRQTVLIFSSAWIREYERLYPFPARMTACLSYDKLIS